MMAQKSLRNLIWVGFGWIASFGLWAELKPYEAEPPDIVLTAPQQANMAAGKLVYVMDHTLGQLKEVAIAFRVKASPEKVWRVLSDFGQYPQWSYRVGSAVGQFLGNDHWLVDFTTHLKQHYYLVHHVPMKDWLSWHTDHSQLNDCVLDTVGFWRVKAVEGFDHLSDVFWYGRMRFSRLCANGIFEIGGFDARSMGQIIYKNLRLQAESLLISGPDPKHTVLPIEP
ncbi:MAG: SRPBCC family protein [Myxococcaceae bacterium]|nr:SRPBCC family protein [Myxococcaceae bacterium]MBH2005900.1 SRPBCC family protein [Myxococcaceae bacterium]